VPVLLLSGHDNTVNRLVATPDGRWLISASNDRTVRYWDLQAAPKKSEAVTLNVRAREDAAVRKKKMPPPVEAKVGVLEPAHVLKHNDWVLGLALTPDGKTLVTGDDKGDVVVWDREAVKELRRWKVKGQVWALAVSPDARLVLASERIHLVFDS